MFKASALKSKTLSHTTGQSKETKKCQGCQKSLPLHRFELDKRNNLRRKTCILCRSNRGREKMNNNPLRYIDNLYSQLKYRRKKTHEFTVTKEYLHYLWKKQKGICRYSGMKMTHIKDGTGYHLSNVSIDRIDNNKGYVKRNIALVCLATNMMKYTLDLDELVDWCKLIADNNRSK